MGAEDCVYSVNGEIIKDVPVKAEIVLTNKEIIVKKNSKEIRMLLKNIKISKLPVLDVVNISGNVSKKNNLLTPRSFNLKIKDSNSFIKRIKKLKKSK